MAGPRVGILVDESGVTSVTLLAGDPPGRRTALRIYSLIQPVLDAFSLQVRKELAAQKRAGRSGRSDGEASRIAAADSDGGRQ